MYLVEPQGASTVPTEYLFLAAQGVLYAMYLMRPDSIVSHTWSVEREAIRKQPQFLSYAFILAGAWGAYFAMEVILNDLCDIWIKLDVKKNPSARTRLCDGITALWGALADQERDNNASMPGFPTIAAEAARDICIEFVATHFEVLQKNGNNEDLMEKFPALRNATFSILARTGKQKIAKCIKCEETGRREKTKAILADVDQRLCTICRALDGNLDLEAKTSPQGRPPIPPKRLAVDLPQHLRIVKRLRVSPLKELGSDEGEPIELD